MMIDRLNYTTHAIKDIRQQQRDISKYGFPAEPHVAQIIDLMDKAVKFILPEHGELLDLTSFDQKHADLIRLPYPITVIEAPFPPRPERRISEDKEMSSKRIGLYVEMTGADVLDVFPGGEKVDPDVEGVLVVSIYYVDSVKTWEVSGCASFVPYDQKSYNRKLGENTDESLKVIAQLEEEGGRFSKNSIRSYLEPIRPLLLNEMRNSGMSDSDIKAAMLGNLVDEQIMMVQLCTVLNCGNVGQEDVDVPKKLAASRAKSGKPPLYVYKVLTVDGEVASNGGVGGSSQDGSQRRTHLRRGHIRRLSNERIIWVRAALVNAGSEAGVVEKSYSVAPVVDATHSLDDDGAALS